MSFGPVSNAGNGPASPFDDPIGSVFGLIAVTAGIVSVAYFWIQSYRRDRALRAMVVRREWQWLGEALPYYLPENELLFPSGSEREYVISNAFAGTVLSHEFIAFDCTLGSGKRKTHLTLVCASAAENPFAITAWNSSYNITSSGDWFAIRPDKTHTLPCAVVEALIDNIRSPVSR